MLTSRTPGVRGDEEPDQAGVDRWQVALEDDGLAELGGSLLHHADQVDELLETLHRRQENKDLALPVLDAKSAPRHLLRLDLLGLPASARGLAARQGCQLVEWRDLGLLGWLGLPGERSKGQAEPDRGVPGDQGEKAPANCPPSRRPAGLLVRMFAAPGGWPRGRDGVKRDHPPDGAAPANLVERGDRGQSSIARCQGSSAGATSVAGGSPPGRLASTWSRCKGSS